MWRWVVGVVVYLALLFWMWCWFAANKQPN